MATVLASFTTLTATPSDPQRALTGYHWTFALCAGLALCAAALAAIMIKDRRRSNRGSFLADSKAGLVSISMILGALESAIIIARYSRYSDYVY